LQALQDENKINVEKIGSVNWYWSFASQDMKTRQKALDDAQVAHDKISSIITDLKAQLVEIRAQRVDEEDMLDTASESRADLVSAKAILEEEVAALTTELAAYNDSDPIELERKKAEVAGFKSEAEQATDDICSLEGWYRVTSCMDNETMRGFRMQNYGDEFDEQEGFLRELDL
jgi:chromosome segregation ATPase